MDLNDLLKNKGFDSRLVLALRHRPTEPKLNKVLPWLAAEKPDVYNAYQQTQGPRLEKVMHSLVTKGYVASFIAHGSGRALFIGIYSITRCRPMTHDEYWNVPAYIEMKGFGMRGFDTEKRSSILWFDLEPVAAYSDWRGKLIIGWSPPERVWWRRSHKNLMPVISILEDSALDAAMPEWNEITLTWKELAVLPSKWKTVLSQWRGIYYIHDTSDGRDYVGSAYGDQNLYGRWLNYAAKGDGGNRLLIQRDPATFRFSILQRVSPDMEASEIIRLENTWKERLHTRAPAGLNAN